MSILKYVFSKLFSCGTKLYSVPTATIKEVNHQVATGGSENGKKHGYWHERMPCLLKNKEQMAKIFRGMHPTTTLTF